jgi:hypothetical protein
MIGQYSDIVAFHGTSAYKARDIFNSGGFAPRSYFAVNYEKFKGLIGFDEEMGLNIFPKEYRVMCSLKGALIQAKHYAKARSFWDYLEYGCGLVDILEEYEEDSLNYIDEEGVINRRAVDDLIQIGIENNYEKVYLEREIDNAFREVGVVFCIGSHFFKCRRVIDFEYNDADICYPNDSCSNDYVSLEYISKIILFS